VSKLFSIIVTLFILVLVYLWIGHITGRDDNIQAPEPTPVTEVTEEKSTPELPLEDNEIEEPGQSRGEDVADDVVDDEEERKPKPVENIPVRPSAKGDHLVIVGNFLEMANAEKHLETVKSLGYPDAEILQFEISQYYTVCASRYDSPTEARRAARKIKEQHGIDAYMRTVN
jgi:hypothetical protein